jgi:hypothetical protein
MRKEAMSDVMFASVRNTVLSICEETDPPTMEDIPVAVEAVWEVITADTMDAVGAALAIVALQSRHVRDTTMHDITRADAETLEIIERGLTALCAVTPSSYMNPLLSCTFVCWACRGATNEELDDLIDLALEMNPDDTLMTLVRKLLTVMPVAEYMQAIREMDRDICLGAA